MTSINLNPSPLPTQHHHLVVCRRGFWVGISMVVANISNEKWVSFLRNPQRQETCLAVPYWNLAFKQSAFPPILIKGSYFLGHYWYFIYTFSLFSGSARTWDFNHQNAVSYSYWVKRTRPSLWAGPLRILVGYPAYTQVCSLQYIAGMFPLKQIQLLVICFRKTIKASFCANMEKTLLSFPILKTNKQTNQVAKKVNCWFNLNISKLVIIFLKYKY